MKGNKSYGLLVVGVAALGGLLFGFDTSIIAGATPFIKQHFNATDDQIEMIVSISVLGALFGALFSGKIADIIGRKRTLIITGILFVAGTVLAAYATSIAMLISGRFLLGIAIGVASYAAPLFIAEVAPAKSRGSLVLWNGAFLTGGQVIAFLVDYGFTAQQDWRAMILSGVIPAVLLTLGMLVMPFSPRWLMAKGKKAQAASVLSKIRHDDKEVHHELREMEKSLNVEKVNFSAIFSKKIRPVLMIGLLLGIFQQFFGINTVMYYGPHVMNAVGFSGAETEMLGTLGLGIVNFVFTVVTIIFIDRIGRRRFLLIGSAMAAMSLFLMIYLLSGNLGKNSAYIALACLFVYIAGYCISVGSLFWLVIAEIFPVAVRGVCMSFVAGIQWGANFLVSATFLTVLNYLGFSLTFSMYGVVAVLAFIFVYFKVPETKGVSLEVIEANIEKGLPSRDLGKTAQ